MSNFLEFIKAVFPLTIVLDVIVVFVMILIANVYHTCRLHYSRYMRKRRKCVILVKLEVIECRDGVRTKSVKKFKVPYNGKEEPQKSKIKYTVKKTYNKEIG